ncbi:hypothetical protein [Reichenbachiella agariperforans]|uniref:DUF3153 domain-containing protein n=1 Tax=Reichenbachiella agariperforans TaxID=156994 RepID=A0A1M6P935_REIAG|nr:hypothetical protein [Reichenbachiella agariperforans]MBU2915376.1 hypothetical protein [Reichenbachiella agariperforans]SHK04443.1 hypothetical protein SAMN04488028_102598 [Reichenbachiella agariperforans]
MKTVILIAAAVFGLSFGLMANSDHVNTFTLWPDQEITVLETSVPREALFEILPKSILDGNPTPTEQEWVALIKKYTVSHTTIIHMDGRDVPFGECQVRMIDGQVDISLELIEKNLNVNDLIISLSFMNERANQKNVIYLSEQQRSFELSAANNYTLVPVIHQSGAYDVAGIELSTLLWVLIPGIMVILLVTVGFRWYEGYLVKEHKFSGQF